MKTPVILSILFMSLVALPAQAEEVRPPRPDFAENQQQRREQFQENQEERRALFEENKEERRDLFETNMAERRELFAENQEERRARIASTTEAWKERISEKVQELVTKRAEHAISLMYAMHDRLVGFAERIEARIAVLEEGGADVGEAQTLLEVAREKLDDAKTAIEAVEDGIVDAFESENPRENLGKVKELLAPAKEALRSAHQALVEVVRALPNMKEDTAEDTNS